MRTINVEIIRNLEPVILMSPEQISVIPNLARIKFGPYQIWAVSNFKKWAESSVQKYI